MSYTFWCSCTHCPDSYVAGDYSKACDWAEQHETTHQGHDVDIDDVLNDEDFT